MFKQNKYTRWYYSIIAARKQQSISGYGEKHHIIPVSLGGARGRENIVKLTAREHWVCHQLLTRMVEGVSRMKMLHTCVLFKKTSGNSRRYQQLKVQRSAAMKGRKQTDQTKEKIGNAHRGRKLSPEHIEKMAATKRGCKMSEATRTKMRIAHYGKRHDEETKQKIGNAHRGKTVVITEEHRKKISNASKGRPKPASFGQKIRAARSQEFLVMCPDGKYETIKFNKKDWAQERGLRLGTLISKSREGISYKGYQII